MDTLNALGSVLAENWAVWVVTLFLILAAVIDGFELKVPNWLTFSMIISGWFYSTCAAAAAGDPWYAGLGWSLVGMAVGLGLLLPLYAIGGMGAGDVKLLAGVGAWMGATHTLYAFCVTGIVGAILAVAMVVCRRAWRKHFNQLWMIVGEILTIRDPNQLSTIAAERKSSMLLLPYGIPIAIGSIAYFAWMGMLV
ncbi:MAG: prepilin peptidase [Planctomycetaceae bacterium]|nr:prepilin peptidase [Planctomycetaceae bacterium]